MKDHNQNNKFFIEIGTADFDTLLPLARNGWSGIFIEPVKDLLDSLERHESCKYLNLAIYNYDGEITIKYVEHPIFAWQKGIGYVDNGDVSWGIGNSFWDNDFKNQAQKQVKCLKLDTLLKEHDIKEIDFLKIDTEGSEFKILEDYSWDVKPKVLKIEYAHWEVGVQGGSPDMQLNPGLIQTWVDKLTNMGYIVYQEKTDIYAIL